MLKTSAGSEGYALVVCYSFFFPKQIEGILTFKINKWFLCCCTLSHFVVAFELALHLNLIIL